MQNSSLKLVGIDVSKDSLDIAIKNQNGYKSLKVDNTVKGFEQLGNQIDIESHCLMEATGPYYLPLACWLYDQGYKVSVLNPLVIKKYSQMRMIRAKTDKADARIIAEYGERQELSLWKPSEDYIYELKQLSALLEQLINQRGVLLKQQKSFAASGKHYASVEEVFIRSIGELNQQVKVVEARMNDLVNQYHGELFKKLSTIPGIGIKTATMLIVISGGFDKFSSAKKLASYIGLCPRIYQSGQMKGKDKICKMGMSGIRAMLYLCSWSAKKCNPGCKNLYDRMVEKGKAKKVALIAVANKLLKQAFAIAKNNTEFDKNYTFNTCL